MALTSETRRVKAQLNANIRWHGTHDERVAQLRRELRQHVVMDHIREAVAAAPPFTAEQIIRLRAIFASPQGADDAPE